MGGDYGLRDGTEEEGMKRIAFIVLDMGVTIRLPYTTEPKHYDNEKSNKVMEQVARVLGGELIYTEEEAPK